MRTLSTLFLVLACAACGDTPVAAEEPARRDFVAGRAVLTGDLATTREGCLMATLYPAGQRMPILSYRVELDDPSVTTEGGERVFTFHLDSETSMVPNTIPEGVPLEVGVRYDRDGAVETSEGDVKARVAVEAGQGDVELTLTP